MNWKIQKHKEEKTRLYILVKQIVEEMKNTWCYDADSWSRHFKDRIKNEISQNNHFAAWHLYTTEVKDINTIEIWKLNVKGEPVFKVFTITKSHESNT